MALFVCYEIGVVARFLFPCLCDCSWLERVGGCADWIDRWLES